MSAPVTVKSFPPPPISQREILRYAGAREGDNALLALLDDCLAQLQGQLTYKVCYCSFPTHVCGDLVDLSFTSVRSAALARALAGCHSIILMAATVGLAPDRLMARYAASAPSKALLVQAIATERVEALCDTAADALRREAAEAGDMLRPRFSPGYGDLPLTLQKEIFAVLAPSRHIGLCLNESMLMSPTKSVTAIIGVAKKEESHER